MIARHAGKITGRHVLVTLLAMFGLIILVNGVFAYFALTSHPGVVTQDSYVKGLRYNDTLDAAAAQRDLGWCAEARFVAKGSRRGLIELRIVDADGRPVGGLDVVATLRRPVTSGIDRTVALDAANDRYGAAVTLPHAGNWDLIVDARRQGRPVFRMEQRLWVK